MAGPVDVFISYVPEDEALCRQLEDHLALLKRDQVIRAWHQRLVGVGVDYRKETDARLLSARVVVLLVSATYLASDRYDDEMTPALARAGEGTALVVPILVRAHDGERAPFSGLTPLPRNKTPVTSWQNRDEAWTDVASGIREAVEGLGGGQKARPAAASADAPEPRYEDDASRLLAKRIEAVRARRRALRDANARTEDVDQELRDLRLLFRENGLRAGDTLGDGRYLLIEAIGRGGFASVWSAVDREGGERVAIKVLHAEKARDVQSRKRFFRGASVMASLGHEAVVRVLDPRGEDGGYLYFVMELVTGGDLYRAVVKGRVTREQAVSIVLGVGEALGEAHAKGFVHRDVKPGNVLLDGSGAPRLTDFDLVAVDSTTDDTRTGAAMGTYLFMAPEQSSNAKGADARADVYGLGMTAIFSLHGRELPELTLRKPERVIAALVCSDATKAALTRAIELDPRDRFADARAFCEALREAAEPPRKPVPRTFDNEAVGLSDPLPPQERAVAPTPVKLVPEARAPAVKPAVELAGKSAAQSAAYVPLVPALPLRMPSKRPTRLSSLPAILASLPAILASLPAILALAAAISGLVVGGVYWANRSDRMDEHQDPPPPPVATVAPDPPPEDLSNSIKPCPDTMVLIPATDAFTMGSNDGDSDEKPPHKVELSAFCMDKTEVTVAAYRRCTKTEQNGLKCPAAPTTVQWEGADVKLWSQFCNGDRADRDTHPINCVDWKQADTYCKWTGGHLPSEAQWEYAARGAEGRKYPWGNEPPPGPTLLNACGSECRALGARNKLTWKAMYEGNDGAEATAPVGTYPKGATPLGLVDMAGNVWEWVEDWYAPYQETTPPPRNPLRDKPATEQRRVVRGGGWNDDDASRVRGAYRDRYGVALRSNSVGFRCARGPN